LIAPTTCSGRSAARAARNFIPAESLCAMSQTLPLIGINATALPSAPDAATTLPPRSTLTLFMPLQNYKVKPQCGG
jgi:hypothetical protein